MLCVLPVLLHTLALPIDGKQKRLAIWQAVSVDKSLRAENRALHEQTFYRQVPFAGVVAEGEDAAALGHFIELLSDGGQ